MEIAEKLAWLGLVLIHLLPAIAVFRPGGLARLYGAKVGALLPLMEHRSLLFMAVLVLSAPHPWALIALLAAPLSLPPTQRVLNGATGPALIPVLGETGRLQIAYGALLAIGLAI